MKGEVTVLSPRATIADRILKTQIENRLSKGVISQTPPGLYRTLDSDEQVLNALRLELIARGLKSDSRIALVYEGGW